MTEPTMKEKRELIKNTYLAHTHSDEGGRFAKTTPNNVIGSSSVSYPRLSSGPWAPQPGPGPEPPYGEDISTPPIVGEQWEIEKSLDENFAVQRTIRDGAPSPSSGTSSRPGDDGLAAPDATAVNPSSPSGLPRPADRDLGKGPHVASEDGVIATRDRGRRTPSSKSNIKRRLM